MDVNFYDNKIDLTSDVEFFVLEINSKKDQLKKLLEEFFKVNIDISVNHLEIDSDPINSADNLKSEAEKFKTKKKEEIDLSQKHPLEIFIINELDGEEQIP
ncbi:hypothetical protein OAQ99_07635, partial [Candidatus Kapabacteria bacterium]|nr:hypothetical protein [Candidatus Kapabacteria bacterium]